MMDDLARRHEAKALAEGKPIVKSAGVSSSHGKQRPKKTSNRKNEQTVEGLLTAPLPERTNFMAKGDEKHTGRVVTGLQSDAHRHYVQRIMEQTKSARKTLEALRGHGYNNREVFLKFRRGKVGEISMENFRKGLHDIAAVDLTDQDFEALQKVVDPLRSGYVYFKDFARALDHVDSAYVARTKSAEHEEHVRLLRERQKVTETPEEHDRHEKALRKMEEAKLVSSLQRQLSVKFGNESGRFRKLYMGLDRMVMRL